MKGFSANIEQLTLANDNFRQVLYTAKHCQLVLMSLPVGGEIGSEVHDENDQFFRFEAGQGKVLIDGNEYAVSDGSAIIVPAGAEHNVINTGDEPLRLYTIYSPAHHKDGIVRATRQEAEANEEDFDGVTTEWGSLSAVLRGDCVNWRGWYVMPRVCYVRRKSWSHLHPLPHTASSNPKAGAWETGNSPCKGILEECKSVRICNEKLPAQWWADFSL